MQQKSLLSQVPAINQMEIWLSNLNLTRQQVYGPHICIKGMNFVSIRNLLSNIHIKMWFMLFQPNTFSSLVYTA